MRAVLETVQHEMGRSQGEAELNRFIDKGVIDELEREGFFQRFELEKKRTVGRW